MSYVRVILLSVFLITGLVNTAVANEVAAQPKQDIKTSIQKKQILDFAKKAFSALYTLDYVNFEYQIEIDLDKYFSAKGRAEQMQYFTANHMHKTMIDGKISTRVNPNILWPPSELIEVESGWVVKFPAQIQFTQEVDGVVSKSIQTYSVESTVIKNPKTGGLVYLIESLSITPVSEKTTVMND